MGDDPCQSSFVADLQGTFADSVTLVHSPSSAVSVCARLWRLLSAQWPGRVPGAVGEDS